MISWTIAHQAPLLVEFSRQEYWSELLFPPPGDLPNPGTEPMSLTSPALQADSPSLCHLSRGLSQNFIPTVPQCLLEWTTHEVSLTAYFTELECVCVCVCVGKGHKHTQGKPTISNKKTNLRVKARRAASCTTLHLCGTPVLFSGLSS